MFTIKMLGSAIGALVGTVALTGTALADTDASLRLGPVPIPDVPVQVCVSQTDVPLPETCVSTPAGQSVSLLVHAKVLTPTVGVVPPTIKQIPCPASTDGVAAEVTAGSAATTVAGSVKIGVNNGDPVTVPLDQTVAVAGKKVTVFACAGIS